MTYYQNWHKRDNKFNAKKTEYNGLRYDSKLEVEKAMELDWMLKAKEIKSWERQVKVEFNFVWSKEQGNWYLTDIPALELKKSGEQFVHLQNYFVDFVVYHNDDSIEYLEMKGYLDIGSKKKAKLIDMLFKDHLFKYYTMERQGGKFYKAKK